jgi:hypothetical protein
VEVAIIGKTTGYFSPTVLLSLLEVSRVVVHAGALGGASWNFQSRVSTISLYAAVHPGASAAGLKKKKKKKKRKKKKKKKRKKNQ